MGLVYDPKPEFLPLLFSLRGATEEAIRTGTSSVKVMNPFDERCCAWDMAKDITGPVTARQIATILVPESDSKSSAGSFFTDATRDLLTGVMLAFIECVPEEQSWTFRDVLLTMLYEPYLRFILSLNRTRDKREFPMLDRLQKSYLGGDERTVSNIRASINTKLAVYEPIAAMWERALKEDKRRKVSLLDWSKGGSSDVLVLGNDESSRYSIDALNRAIFKRACECLLSRKEQTPLQRESGDSQVWVILDEVREAGKLDGLSSLMTKGRSKGVCMVLGFQDINGLRDVYSEEIANEIVAQCNNISIMRVNSPDTANWASELFGRRKLTAKSKDVSLGREGHVQIGRGASEQELPYLFSADFLYLPLPNTTAKVTGYIKSPDLNPENGISEISFSVPLESKNASQSQVNQTFLEYEPSNEREHYLCPWDEKDWERLGLDTIISAPIKYNSPEHHLPKIESETLTLRKVKK